jgi:chromosome segregation ATPase
MDDLEVVPTDTLNKMLEMQIRIEQLETALQRANATTEEYERKFYLGSDRIEQLEAAYAQQQQVWSDAIARADCYEAALRKIAAIEDEVINVPKTEEGAHLWTYLWTALDMCFELSEAALGEKKDG